MARRPGIDCRRLSILCATEREGARPRFKSGVLLTALITALTVVGCTQSVAVPTPTPSVGSVADQQARGAPPYTQNCATADCHGTHGEGIRADSSFRAWPLVGKDFQTRNPNAQVAFDVVRSGDEQNLRAMSDQQIYDAIAFELSQNNVNLTSPLTMQNAATKLSGDVSVDAAAIYPPLNNVKLLARSNPPRSTPCFASNDCLALRVDQVAEASSIGNADPPSGGAFALIVFAMQDLADHPLQVDPKFLRLVDSGGSISEPQAIELASPIERFHPIMIQPMHGTAAIAVFSLAPNTSPDRLVYDDATGHSFTCSLK